MYLLSTYYICCGLKTLSTQSALHGTLLVRVLGYFLCWWYFLFFHWFLLWFTSFVWIFALNMILNCFKVYTCQLLNCHFFLLGASFIYIELEIAFMLLPCIPSSHKFIFTSSSVFWFGCMFVLKHVLKREKVSS
jgi:hypothetical protein